MEKPRQLALLLVAALLALTLSQGVVVAVEGRNVQLVKPVQRYGRWRSPLHGRLQQEEAEAAAAGGMVSTVMDYADPKPNTNPRGGVLPPPDPSSPPAH